MMSIHQVGMTMRLLSLCALSAGAPIARADSVSDDVKKDGNDAKRSVKKAGHRVDEAACTGSKADCEAKKGKHRVQEAGQTVSDKADETSDKVKEGTK